MTEDLTVGNVVAQQIRRYRQAKGWSVRELADACASAGSVDLTQASLANIERGQGASAQRRGREVTVEELVTLAVVLGVPPLALLLPVDGDQRPASADIDVTPSMRVSWYTYTTWWRAQGLLAPELKPGALGNAWGVTDLFAVLDTYRTACENEAAARRLIGDKPADADDELAVATELAYRSALRRFVSALSAMIDRGIVPPKPRDASVLIPRIRGAHSPADKIEPELREQYGLRGFELQQDVVDLLASWESPDAG